MIPYLDSTDPRIGITAGPANLQDSTTRFAVRAVMDAVGPSGDNVVGAPSLGYPVRVLAVRGGDAVQCILNPFVASAGRLYLSRGETSPHTGPMRRDAWRAADVTIGGTGMNGKPVIVPISPTANIAAQQAMDIMDDASPFGWMTPFHHIWRRIRSSAHAARFHTLSEGLFANDDLGSVINRTNPMVPSTTIERALLALSLQFTGMRTFYLPHGGYVGLATALVLVSPQVKISVDQGSWPRETVVKLGLSSCVLPCHAAPEGPIDGVFWDATRHPLADMAPIARLVAGASGMVMVAVASPDPVIEDVLQRNFACLCRFDLHDGTVIYGARKSTFDASEMRPRLMLAASRIGAVDALVPVFSGQWMLRKDGYKVAL